MTWTSRLLIGKAFTILACAVVLWVCGVVAVPLAAAESTDRQTPPILAGTAWRLVEFQSMDDAIGTVHPQDASLYTMRLHGDGTVQMRLNCNQANGSWSATPSSDTASGGFAFGPLAMTRAFCPPPSMDASIAAQAQYIRSYLLKDGRLYLSLMADGGIYAWEPLKDDTLATAIPADPETGGPRNWEVSGVSRALKLREEPSTSAPVLSRYRPGTLLDNLGCRQVQGRVWCDVQQLGGGPRGFVAAEFLKPAVSPDGSVAMGPDDSAQRALRNPRCRGPGGIKRPAGPGWPESGYGKPGL